MEVMSAPAKTSKTEEKLTKLSLATKLARIGKEIGTVDKTGKNQQQNYNYIEYGVVAGRIRELFDIYGVIIIPNVDEYSVDEILNKYGNKGYHYTLKMSFRIVNGDDANDFLTAQWMGESADYGDKGINKAETSGTKYFLMRLFNISEKGEEEADEKSPEIVDTQKKTSTSISKGNQKVDFVAVRKAINGAKSVDELNKIYLSVPEKLRQYFVKNCEARKAELSAPTEEIPYPTNEELAQYE